MATKKCPNGHQYDSSIYGDNCPFCPESSHTRVNNPTSGFDDATRRTGNWVGCETGVTVPYQDDFGGGHTVIRNLNGTDGSNPDGGRKVVGLLVSYSANPAGEIYKVYEGRTTIGRDSTCDIPFPNDTHMSAKHFLIQFVEAKGVFKAKDQGSSNGTFVNGQVYVMDEPIDLKTNDVLVLGETKLVFLAIPEF